MAQLVLIDGSSYLFRAFHALPPLTTAAGEPTGALFGVVNMLRTTLADQPSHVAFVLDAPGPTFRHERFPAYKAQREAMPEDLAAQIEPLKSIVAALGLPCLCVAGVEADDVIGTLALAAHARDIDVIVSTSDKDFAQLVRPGIKLINTMSGTELDSAGVVEKFGVEPSRITDYLALMGDSVDNIPGIDKCGPKTAAKWIAAYGDLDGVIAAAADMPGKIGENLRAALPRLPLNHELVTIRGDCELDRGIDDLTRRPPDVDALRALYNRFEMKAALRELDANAHSDPASLGASAEQTEQPVVAALAQANPADYALLDSLARLQAFAARIEATRRFVFEAHADGPDPMQAGLVGLGLAVGAGAQDAAYLPLAHHGLVEALDFDRATALAVLRPLFERDDIAKVSHHGKAGLHLLAQHGINLQGYADDTMLQGFVLDAGAATHELEALSLKHFEVSGIDRAGLIGRGAKKLAFAAVSLGAAKDFAAQRADLIWQLHQWLGERLQLARALDAVYRDIEMPLVPVLSRIEENGVLIDADVLGRLSDEFGARMAEAQRTAHAAAGEVFSLDSPKQLQQVLFEKLRLPVIGKTPKGAPSTNEDTLSQLADEHPLPRLILEYRGLAKLCSTYTDKLPHAIHPRTQRVHTSYHQAGAATGRVASSDPNLQNIPIRTADGRRIRAAFIAPAGRRIVAADYSQIELRIMAHLSADEGLLSAFRSGADIHRATAAEVFDVPLDAVSNEQRRAAKAVNFGLMYGMSAFGLAKNLGIDRGDAQGIIARYFARYPGVAAFMDSMREQVRARGYVETVFGRRLHLPDSRSRNANRRAGAERAAINAPMQGTAADIIKRAMVAVDRLLEGFASRALMVMQVHDELVFECDAAVVEALSTQVREAMEGAAELAVPLEVDIGVGANWDVAH